MTARADLDSEKPSSYCNGAAGAVLVGRFVVSQGAALTRILFHMGWGEGAPRNSPWLGFSKWMKGGRRKLLGTG